MSSAQYKYPLDQCDIQDKALGERFRRKRSEWHEWFFGDDPYSISNQISRLFWDHAVYWTVRKLREKALDTPDAGVGFNEPMMWLLDVGFTSLQCLRIRSITDKAASKPERAVISLPTILKDIRQHRGLITRENYVCFDGLPYDYEEVRSEVHSRIPRNESAVSFRADPPEGPKAWGASMEMHKWFDSLSKVDQNARARTDLIRESWLDELEKKLAVCKSLKRHVDKFIAHSSDPKSRTRLTPEEKAPTFEQLEQCLRSVCDVAHFISWPLLGGTSFNAFPIPQFDHLKGIEMRLVRPEDIECVRKAWDQEVKKLRDIENAAQRQIHTSDIS